MPTWLDENTIDGEMPEADFIEEVNKVMALRVEKEKQERQPREYGNDGLLTVYEEKQSHAGINYSLKAMRYFAVTRLANGSFELRATGMNKVGKHVVVEHDGTRVSSELRDLLNLDEFLWHDTLHAGQEDWTLKQQWEYADNLAKGDCERVSKLKDTFALRIRELRRELHSWIKQVKHCPQNV